MLFFTGFNSTFNIHTGTRNFHLVELLSQDQKPVARFWGELMDTQKRYTTTDKELLIILETIKDISKILLGNKIMV